MKSYYFTPKHFRHTACVLVMLIMGIAAKSQEKTEKQEQVPYFNFAFCLGAPINDFARNTDAIGFGAKAHYYMPFNRKIPLFLGLGAGIMWFGSSSDQLNEEVKVTSGSTVLAVIPINLEAQTDNKMINGFVSIRYLFPMEYVHPYIEAIGGCNYLATRTTIYDRTPNKWLSHGSDNGEINSKRLSSGFTYHYGGEVGFLISLSKKHFIRIGMAYLKGGEAEYYDKSQTEHWDVEFTGNTGSFNPDDINSSDIQVNNNATPKKSTTDMLLFNLGFTVAIFR